MDRSDLTLTKAAACEQKFTGADDVQTPQSLHPASRTARRNHYSKADWGITHKLRQHGIMSNDTKAVLEYELVVVRGAEQELPSVVHRHDDGGCVSPDLCKISCVGRCSPPNMQGHMVLLCGWIDPPLTYAMARASTWIYKVCNHVPEENHVLGTRCRQANFKRNNSASTRRDGGGAIIEEEWSHGGETM